MVQSIVSNSRKGFSGNVQNFRDGLVKQIPKESSTRADYLELVDRVVDFYRGGGESHLDLLEDWITEMKRKLTEVKRKRQ